MIMQLVDGHGNDEHICIKNKSTVEILKYSFCIGIFVANSVINW